MYHGILINKQFSDESFAETLTQFAKKNSGDWIIYGVEITEDNFDETIRIIQEAMRPNEPWYCHFYNDKEMVVVFKEKIITASSHISTWGEIFAYGKTLNIPEKQLDFWPNRFQDERHYFGE